MRVFPREVLMKKYLPLFLTLLFISSLYSAERIVIAEELYQEG
jgi:hypothetical protein